MRQNQKIIGQPGRIKNAEQAAITFADRLQIALARTDRGDMSAALHGLADLSQHHPSLQPEVNAIRGICEGFDVLDKFMAEVDSF